MKSASDIWVCGVCRSINSIRSGRCYSCSTPIAVAAAKPEELSVHAKPREVHLVPTGTYRSGETFAVLLSVAAAAFIFATLLALWTLFNVADLRAEGERAAADQLFADRFLFLAAAPATGILALLAFATWIRQAVANLPTLGLGYARVSPSFAFLEPLIPGFNVYSIPARVAEVAQKLGGGTYELALIGVAWILVVGPSVLLVYAARFTGLFGSGADYLRATSIAAIATFVFQAIAIVLMLLVVWQVERLMRDKAAQLGSTSTEPATTTPEPATTTQERATTTPAD